MSFRHSKPFVAFLLILTTLFISAITVKPVFGAVFTVNSAENSNDVNPGNGVCETAAGNGVCTLRAAIQETNALPGADTITFSIAPDNPPIDRVIEVPWALPGIADQLTIQGPNLGGIGAGANIVLDGDGTFTGLDVGADSCAIRKLTIRNFYRGIYSKDTSGLLIVGNRIGKFGYSGIQPAEGNFLEGVSLDGVIGAVIGGDTAADRNIISGNGANGILLINSASVLIRGNYIGTNEDGTTSLPNGYDGIRIAGSESTGNTIGGSTAARRNIISGNTGNGILLGADDNDVFGNYIGLNPSGTSALPNGRDGIYIYANPEGEQPPIIGNEIGGTLAGQGNIISGNTSAGIHLFNANENYIKNNIIGLNASGTAAVPNEKGIVVARGSANEIGTYETGSGNIISGNQNDGIYLVNATVIGTTIRRNLIGTNFSGSILPNGGEGIAIEYATETIIGGGTDFGNIIANNGSDGVEIFWANQNTVNYNRIYNNGALGLDLLGSAWETGVTLNDVNDEDGGSNNQQNFPILLRVYDSSPGQVTIEGLLNSAKERNFVIHLYANSSKDPSGYGEGEVYLGSKGVATNSEYIGNFTATFSVPTPFACITATATDSAGNTSEFSPCVAVMNYQQFLPMILR